MALQSENTLLDKDYEKTPILRTQLIRKGALYKMLEDITRKKRGTMRAFFCRKKLSVDNHKDFLAYIAKYGKK